MQQLPQYIQNIFSACGYDTLQEIAEMDVNQSSECNEINNAGVHQENFSLYEERYALSLTVLYGPVLLNSISKWASIKTQKEWLNE